MKKMISNAVLIATLVSTTPGFSAVNKVKTEKDPIVKVSNTAAFGVLFSNYKKAVIQDGVSAQLASANFIKDIKNSGLSEKDIRAYAVTNMTVENYLAFSKTLDKGIRSLNGNNISEKKLVRVIENLVKSEQREGANWISCGAGLGIGIPLMVAGIVTGIVALSLKEVKTNEVEKKYIDLRKRALDEYTADELARQDAIVAYESDIDAYNAAIEELQRRIDSGIYGAIEIEQMNQEIAALGVSISDSQAAIAQLVNDQPQLYATYEQEIANLNELEVNEIEGVADENERKEKSKKVLGLTSAVTIPLGLVLTLGGAGDC